MQGYMDEYQKIQKENFFKGCRYLLSFVNEPGTSAKFMGCYEVGSGVPVQPSMMPAQYPTASMFASGHVYYDLVKTDLLGDLVGRLSIEWGKAAISWQQWATNEKAVLAIQESPRLAFNGFENVLVGYGELSEILSDPTLYEIWHTALSSVNAIYLIADRTNGKLHVGSAYGSGGLLGRWKSYVETKHGGNKGIIDLLKGSEDRFQHFQFSILQILPKTITADEVVEVENLYKRKLLSIPYGLNQN